MVYLLEYSAILSVNEKYVSSIERAYVRHLSMRQGTPPHPPREGCARKPRQKYFIGTYSPIVSPVTLHEITPPLLIYYISAIDFHYNSFFLSLC